MKSRLPAVAFAVAFVVALGMAPRTSPLGVSFPAPAYAAGTCSLAPLVCANDSSPGCETICSGEQRAVCVEGSCSAAGNIVSSNSCTCK